MAEFDALVKEVGGRSQETQISISLVDSVMASGYRVYLTMTQRFINSEERKKADHYSHLALRYRDTVLNLPNTLSKLQVSTSL